MVTIDFDNILSEKLMGCPYINICPYMNDNNTEQVKKRNIIPKPVVAYLTTATEGDNKGKLLSFVGCAYDSKTNCSYPSQLYNQVIIQKNQLDILTAVDDLSSKISSLSSRLPEDKSSEVLKIITDWEKKVKQAVAVFGNTK